MLWQCFRANWSTTDQFHSFVAIKKWCSYSFCHQYVWNIRLSLILVPQALKCIRSRLVLKIWSAGVVVKLQINHSLTAKLMHCLRRAYFLQPITIIRHWQQKQAKHPCRTRCPKLSFYDVYVKNFLGQIRILCFLHSTYRLSCLVC